MWKLTKFYIILMKKCCLYITYVCHANLGWSPQWQESPG